MSRAWVVLYQQSEREWRWGHQWQGLIYLGLALGAAYGIFAGLRSQDPLVQRAMFVFIPVCCFGLYKFTNLAWKHLADANRAKRVLSGQISHLESKSYIDLKHTKLLYLLTISSQVFDVPHTVYNQLRVGQQVKLEVGPHTKEVASLYVQK